MSSEIKNIPFAFCTVDRAAKYLSIETEDLLSLAVMNKISLHIHLSNVTSRLYIKGESKSVNSWYQELNTNINQVPFEIEVSNYSSFTSYNEQLTLKDKTPLFKDSIYLGSGISESMDGTASGLWGLSVDLIKKIHFNGYAEHTFEPLYLPDQDKHNQIGWLSILPCNYDDLTAIGDGYQDEEYKTRTIYTKDLWITSEQVRIILNHDSDLLTLKSINRYGGLDRSPPNQRPLPRMNVHQFNLIYSLMKVVGFTDDEIKNSSGEAINKKLRDIGEEKKISMPQPDKNTWLKWREKLLNIMR